MVLSLFRPKRVRSARPSRHAARKPAFLPRIEQLEDRRVPTLVPAVLWEDESQEGRWANPLNWNDDSAPGSAAMAISESLLIDAGFDAEAASVFGPEPEVFEDTLDVTLLASADLLSGISADMLQMPLVAPQITEGESLTLAGIHLHGMATAILDLVLGVQHGTLSIPGEDAEAVIQNNHAPQVSLYGTVAGLNSVLVTLVYRPDLGFRGLDTLEAKVALEDGTEQTSSLPIFVRAVVSSSPSASGIATGTNVLPFAVARTTPVDNEPAPDRSVPQPRIDTGGVGGPLPAKAPEPTNQNNNNNVGGEPVREEPVESRSLRFNLDSLFRLLDWRRPAPEPQNVPEPPAPEPQSWNFDEELFHDKAPAFALVDYPCEPSPDWSAAALAGVALGLTVEPRKRKRKRFILRMR